MHPQRKMRVPLLILTIFYEAHAEMCTLGVMGERMSSLHARLRGGAELSTGPGTFVVRSEPIRDILSDLAERRGEIPSLSATEIAASRDLMLQNVPFVIRNAPSISTPAP